MLIAIREMQSPDITDVAVAHEQSFPRQNNSQKWIECNFNAYPRILIYVAECDASIVGYIQWIQKSGFRNEAVIELEQIAVLEEYRGKGVGRVLILESLDLVKKHLKNCESVVKSIIVTTRVDNDAKKLYESTLGVKEEHVIKRLYSGDEVILIARDVS